MEQLSVDPGGSLVFSDAERLAREAAKLVFAEQFSDQMPLLATAALTNLAVRHRTRAPAVVVVGAKGAGKTFTYLQLCTRGLWSKFGQAVTQVPSKYDGWIVPVLGSMNLGEGTQDLVSQARARAARALGSHLEPWKDVEAREFVKGSFDRAEDDAHRRRIWLTVLARSAGLDAEPEDAEDVLTRLATGHKAVFVIDGLEDLFQDLVGKEKERAALRVLLTSVVDWVGSLRDRPLGLVVLVRRDLVHAAISQNTGQYLQRYAEYELRWSQDEALLSVAIQSEPVEGL